MDDEKGPPWSITSPWCRKVNSQTVLSPEDQGPCENLQSQSVYLLRRQKNQYISFLKKDTYLWGNILSCVYGTRGQENILYRWACYVRPTWQEGEFSNRLNRGSEQFENITWPRQNHTQCGGISSLNLEFLCRGMNHEWGINYIKHVFEH